HLEVVRVLLKAGAKVESKDKEGKTPLRYASRSDNSAVVRFLLEAGASPESIGWSPLMTAAVWGDVARLKAALKGKANLEAKDAEGRTALILAARFGNVDVVKALLDAGARVEA